MGGDSRRHGLVLEELTQWWEDLWGLGTGSRVVLITVPPRWGVSTVLERFAAITQQDGAPVTVVVRIEGKALRALTSDTGVQAQVLRDMLAEAGWHNRAAELVGADRLGGALQLGAGVGGLFVSPLASAAALMLASIAVGAAGKLWDDSPGGRQGAAARSARSVAALSARVPVVVIIDDADSLDSSLAVTLIQNLAERPDGQVLVIAATHPGNDKGESLSKTLATRVGHGGPDSRVRQAEADTDMGYLPRVQLARELCPALPDVAARRIAERTATFADVFAITSRLRYTGQVDGDPSVLTVVDNVIDTAMLARPLTAEALILAWAGGIMHARQVQRALEVLGAEPQDSDINVVRTGALISLTDPASARFSTVLNPLAPAARQQMAAGALDMAISVAADRATGLVERVVAARAAHQVRGDLANPARLVPVQCDLARCLESVGDLAAAYEVSSVALAECPPGNEYRHEREELSAALLRLARRIPERREDPLVADLVRTALEGRAVIGLEACLWAVIDLFEMPEQRERALALADQIAAELITRGDLGPEASDWRRLLAFHAGQAGHPSLARRVLAPELDSPSPERHAAALATLYALDGLRADMRLQITVCEAELTATPQDADEARLRLHQALAKNYHALGDYRRGLSHAQQELPLHHRLQGPDHPDTLANRHTIAHLTGMSGDHAAALDSFRRLLPDRRRVLGPGHADTLATRYSIGWWTGECGDVAGALRQFQELLPDCVQALGFYHRMTLGVRYNIANWTGQCGNAGRAWQLFQQLLPDQEASLGPDDGDTLATRGKIARWTGLSGDAGEAWRLSELVRADRERVLGPDHPSTLNARAEIAHWAGASGDTPAALHLLQELLPDNERIDGPDHPDTLATRTNIAHWIGESGDAATALRLLGQLLPEVERVLGPDHRSALAVRNNIASWTYETGDVAAAVRLSRSVLADRERVLGPRHPDTLANRRDLANWTGVRAWIRE